MEWYVIVLLFLVITTASGGAGFFYKKITSLHEEGNDIPVVLSSAPIPLVLLFTILASIAGWEFTLPNIVCGMLGGLCFSIAVAMLLLSVSKGNYSVSVIIINLSFFIPICLASAFLGENTKVTQLIGIVLLVLVIVFSNIRFRRKEAEGKRSNIWLIYALLSCLCNGLVNFSLKVQQYYSPGTGQDTFYFVMYATALVSGLVLLLALKSSRVHRAHALRVPLAGAGLGLCVAFNYYPMSYLAPHVNSALLFGVSTAGAILMSLLAGWIFFREKITARSIVSLISCIAAIILQVLSL